MIFGKEKWKQTALCGMKKKNANTLIFFILSDQGKRASLRSLIQMRWRLIFGPGTNR